MSHGVSKVFVSAIVRNKRIPESLLEEVNKKISFLCKKNNNFIFVDNSNVSNIYLFDDGLHLMESGRCILENNVFGCINIFLLTDLHHPIIHTHNGVIHGISLREVYRSNMQISDLQILRKLRLKYSRNPFIRYIKYSLRNKIIDVRQLIGRLQLDYFVII